MAMNRIVDHLVQLPQLPEDIHNSPEGTAEKIPQGSMLFNINILKGDSAAGDEGAVSPLDAVKEKWRCQRLWCKCFLPGVRAEMGRITTVPFMAGGESCGFVAGWLVPAPLPAYPHCR